jgi:error-prone DNA polymerase
MLNSMPLGFYSASQLVQDAQRHGVKVLPADVTISHWDSVLERHGPASRPAVRLGLSLLKGLKDGAAERIEAARAVRQFASVSDLAKRAQLDRKDLQGLAAANSLSALAGNRREALWASVAAVPDRDILADARVDDETPVLGAPSEGEDIVADYNSMSLTLGWHPLSLLRPVLLEHRLVPAATLMTYRNGRLARGCGLVMVRQRPGTANGVMFATIEDEAGNVNVITLAVAAGRVPAGSAGCLSAGALRNVAMRGRGPPSPRAATCPHVAPARWAHGSQSKFSVELERPLHVAPYLTSYANRR